MNRLFTELNPRPLHPRAAGNLEYVYDALERISDQGILQVAEAVERAAEGFDPEGAQWLAVRLLALELSQIPARRRSDFLEAEAAFLGGHATGIDVDPEGGWRAWCRGCITWDAPLRATRAEAWHDADAHGPRSRL